MLGIKELCKEEILEILTVAKEKKNNLLSSAKTNAVLYGKTVVTLFYENSTRTRLSFELAAKNLGANYANVESSSSSVSKGESWVDTIRTIDSMCVDVIVLRHYLSGSVALVTKQTKIKASIINAGDGMNEHPTQALLDAFTIIEKKKNIAELQIVIIGDILHSRVARSNIYLLKKLGASVCVFAPLTLMCSEIEHIGVKILRDFDQAINDSDVIIDLRLQIERQQNALIPSQREYCEFYGLTEKRLQKAKPSSFVMHPGPINRGVEITSAVADSAQAVINNQITNGLAVRMAILEILTKPHN